MLICIRQIALNENYYTIKLFSYRSCDAEQRQALAVKARHAATVSAKRLSLYNTFP
jgi:hypothetical protein